ncbi:MAG TPA: T9SS type A sorting domain-containing protein [Bacteroidetes bacterium]|nr:T9SS type A sorting domain-containing protein [Bacteroidota bacterium]
MKQKTSSLFRFAVLLCVASFFAEINAQTTTPYMYDNIANNWTGNGVAGIYRSLGTPNHKFTRIANSTGDNFYKIYNQSNNTNNDFNNPSGSKVWSGSLSINTEGTAFAYGDGNGGAGSYSITNGNYYTYCWEDVGTSSNAKAIVMETSAMPVTLDSRSQSPLESNVHEGQSVTVTLNLSGAPSTEEKFYLRYSTDGFTSYGTLLSPSSGSGTATQEFTIPSQTEGTTVTYYLLSSTLAGFGGSSASTDLATIEFLRNGASNFSYTVLAALPVELISFEVYKRAEGTALTWRTASEQNNSHFNIEKSSNARTWQTIGTIQGHGTTQQEQQYSFIDKNPINGINYYRLKQVDFDGRSEYSKTVSVDFSNDDGVSIYPNPVRDRLYILSKNKEEGPVGVNIYNVQGQLLKNEFITSEKAVDTYALRPGMYFIEIKNDNGRGILMERFFKK